MYNFIKGKISFTSIITIMIKLFKKKTKHYKINSVDKRILKIILTSRMVTTLYFL